MKGRGGRAITPADVLIVMGVSGVGKSTVAEGIARAMGWEVIEGDDLHPPANLAKMRSGRALDDDDRAPWLTAIRDALAERVAAGESVVASCSALRRAHRDILRTSGPLVRFLHLVGEPSLVRDRMRQREGHVMPLSLLPSQFEALEALAADEVRAGSLVVSVDGTVDQVLDRARAGLLGAMLRTL